MKRPLIYFDRPNVMLIRESDVPNRPRICSDNSENRDCNESKDHIKTFDWIATDANPVGCSCKNMVIQYNAALEAAKNKAIRVDNWKEYGLIATSVPNTGELIDLPEGYSYEERCDRPECVRHNETRKNKQCKYAHGGLPNCYIYCIINPIAQPESEDELWWKFFNEVVMEYDDSTIAALVDKFKSKYHLTRKP